MNNTTEHHENTLAPAEQAGALLALRIAHKLGGDLNTAGKLAPVGEALNYAMEQRALDQLTLIAGAIENESRQNGFTGKNWTGRAVRTLNDAPGVLSVNDARLMVRGARHPRRGDLQPFRTAGAELVEVCAEVCAEAFPVIYEQCRREYVAELCAGNVRGPVKGVYNADGFYILNGLGHLAFAGRCQGWPLHDIREACEHEARLFCTVAGERGEYKIREGATLRRIEQHES